MATDRQERIRRKAHQIWDRSGRPDGHHDEHWRQATAEIEQEDAAPRPEKRKPADQHASPSAEKRSRRAADGIAGASGSAEGNTAATANDAEAIRLAETSDLSPNQAKDLLRKHRGNQAKVKEEAKNFKAES